MIIKVSSKYIIVFLMLLAQVLVSCERKKNPPRDEIPVIKDLLGHFEQAVKERNAAAIDSLMIAEALELGYSSQTILSTVYPDYENDTFLGFGNRSFFYTKDKASVTCDIMSDTTDTGRPVEITLVKVDETWLIKRFDLK